MLDFYSSGDLLRRKKSIMDFMANSNSQKTTPAILKIQQFLITYTTLESSAIELSYKRGYSVFQKKCVQET